MTRRRDSEDETQPRGGLRRREFLVLGTASFMLVGAAVAWRWLDRFRPHRMKGERLGYWFQRYRYAALPLAEAIVQHFHYLRFERGIAERFEREYATLAAREGFREPRERLYLRFLLSTDFYQNGADESIPLDYVMLFDPHESTCYNPFATFN